MLLSGRTIGNDYQKVQIWEAQILRFYHAEGLEPMWHLTGGIPMAGLSMAQAFHSPAWVSSWYPGFWTGDALTPTTLRELLLFALGHAVYYFAVRSLLGVSPGAAYLLAFIAVYNSRNLDALRYGPALDATVYGHALILLAAAHLVRPSRTLLLLVACSSQLLLTSGYPVGLPAWSRSRCS